MKVSFKNSKRHQSTGVYEYRLALHLEAVYRHVYKGTVTNFVSCYPVSNQTMLDYNQVGHSVHIQDKGFNI